ncbi:MAG: hypothetical protein J6B63_02015 [Treponema sp.]|nr:hypothetical protein [Treponema sp.]
MTKRDNPHQYWRKMGDRELKQYELYPIWIQLKLPCSDGKAYKTDYANVKSR